MKNIVTCVFGLLVIVLLVKCKEAYDPDIELSATNLLVVEGFLNANGATSIKLSRSRSNDSQRIILESNASVSVEDENNIKSVLPEISSGVYAKVLAIEIGKKYRLLISTKGKDYASEYVTLKSTPQIDSLPWKRINNGVQIYVNTHDKENSTRYYRWEYEETWSIIPEFHSSLELVPRLNPQPREFEYIFVERTPETTLPKICWQSEISKNIILGSSSKLREDVINLAPVCYIPQASWKIASRYSILIRQYSLTQAGFEYWQNMKKNTEGLGSIFDPQPSEIRGNIVCVTSPDDMVIGFFDASTVQEKRIFISNSEVPGWQYNPGCVMASAFDNPDSLRLIFPHSIPLYKDSEKSRYVGATPYCVDCRLRGNIEKPNFW